MQEVKKYPHGLFSWVDLATTDAESAKKFYTGLFGWGINEVPMGDGAFYTMLTLNGKDVAALSQMSAEQAQQMPPVWNNYITVDNVDELTAKVPGLGGTVMMEPFDVFDAGRMSVIQDPTGAVVSLWQAKNHIGSKYVNVPGAFTWNELATTDTNKAGAFYKNLFGWEIQSQDMGNGVVYNTFTNKGRMNGGMMPLDDERKNMGVPSHWTVYFAVANCDASVEKAASLGGNILMPATDIPGTGRFAFVQDPQGAVFAIIQMDRADGPPEG